LAIVGPPSQGTVHDYKEVFAASYRDSIFAADPDKFWRSVEDVWSAQEEFLGLFYLLVLVEAVGFVVLVRMYGNWKTFRPYGWIVEEVLLRGVNEWHVLLTDFNFPDKPKRKVAADLLTQEDHLYQGNVADYFTDSEGGLSGLVLEKPRRFDRPGYLTAKEKEKEGCPVQAGDYWKPIRGENLFVPGEKILSLNLRYEGEATPEDAAEIATRELVESGDLLRVEVPTEAERNMAIRLPRVCKNCGQETLPEHRGESAQDGAQHYDLICAAGHKTQLHFLVTNPLSTADVRPTDCLAGCQFHS
jgi:hypothetical protein